ncbi:alpha-2-macroglobulin-like isoform X2 [Dunckerocampus dactyliophorus]|uniref:alpha-2-macroglobulin-like isoform X2 n=1 Tax=Dunckerocampus dactyliophorus TaxID=161453 RepID=UPI0024056861|nr:alpha-2-macroglobulin-like isoform X2 [Dunckerocampus dactyliophorus]
MKKERLRKAPRRQLQCQWNDSLHHQNPTRTGLRGPSGGSIMAAVMTQSWMWTCWILFSWMCVGRTEAGPHYLVGIPATLEAGADTNFCASLLQPNETLTMTVSLKSKEEMILFRETSSKDFHKCISFKVPVPNDDEEVREMVVEVQGATFYSREVRKVLIKVYEPMTFVQTDKPIYLPGQTVQFRVVSMDTKFRPAFRLYNTIEIEDPNRNRIGQWLNQTSESKILQLSYSLNSEAREGTYQLIVSVGEMKMYQDFKVEKYVLPKFDVKIEGPDKVAVIEDDLIFDVCAQYTYGQPVPGSAAIKVCRPLYSYIYLNSGTPNGAPEIKPPCYEDKKQTDKKGCASFTVKLSTFTKIDQKAVQDVLEVEAQVKETGTDIALTSFSRTQISYVIGKLSFVDMDKIYEEGTTVYGKVKAVHYNDTPIADMDVYLLEGQSWMPRLLKNLTTNSDGFAKFSLNTDDLKGDIQLYVSGSANLNFPYRAPHYENGEHTLSLFQEPSPHTKSVSYLMVKKMENPIPCDANAEITVQYAIAGESRGYADIIYLVLSRGAIVFQGAQKIRVEDGSVNEGEMTFQLPVSPAMAPALQVVAYAVLPSATVVAHSEDFTTDTCFTNKVSVEFSPPSAVPGEETTLQVTAEPNSLCGVSAVDQSVLIKEPGKTLNADKIFGLLPVKKATYYPYSVEDSVECLLVRPRRSILPYPGGDISDPYTVFQGNGLKMATNLFIRVPSCLKYLGREYNRPYGIALRYESAPNVAVAVDLAAGPMGGGFSHEAPIETIRNFFPETMLWSLVEVGNSGTQDVAVTAPDTITTWETEAFCLSSQGFGLAPRQKLTVFQPFFLELTLPYSIKRGEHFELKATTFNFLSKCIMVSVTPAPSDAYALTALSGDLYNSCLCGNERKTVRWTMAPSNLGTVEVTVTAEAVPSRASCDNEVVSVPARGRRDVVTRSLIVKAEGSEMTQTYNWLLCPKGESLKEEVEIELPKDVIKGSARGLLSVLGDILGRALKNLEGLLKMPYGCGEQNMARLAPNVYILQYLKQTNQLTPAIEEKTLKFLTSGYQRQLNYKHGSGGYSTFGTGKENTWLTAFVARVFGKAMSFIYIDPSTLEDSKNWLKQQQKDNGCFQQSGRLFHNRMKGGVSDEVTLTAYITAAFLEMNSSVKDPVVTKSLSCLRETTDDINNIYTTALMAYVFTLADDQETRAKLLQQLDNVKIQQGGLIHWSQKSSETSASLSVEISSYVLLAKLSGTPSAEDLGYASSIVRWLTRQQNYYGGFASTQDTVVALQALSLYSTLVFSPGGSSTVTVVSPSEQLTFDVNQNNKLLYQEKVLKDVEGKYNVEVKGSTCAAVQLSLLYNIPTPTTVTTLTVSVRPEANCTIQTSRPKLTLKIKSIYSGKESSTNMVILEINLLSGFKPESESLKRLKGALLVERVEEKEDQVLVYLKELPKDIAINHSLDLVQEIPVNGLKPAIVKIYDYYQPSDQGEATYNYVCLQEA